MKQKLKTIITNLAVLNYGTNVSLADVANGEIGDCFQNHIKKKNFGGFDGEGVIPDNGN